MAENGNGDGLAAFLEALNEDPRIVESLCEKYAAAFHDTAAQYGFQIPRNRSRIQLEDEKIRDLLDVVRPRNDVPKSEHFAGWWGNSWLVSSADAARVPGSHGELHRFYMDLANNDRWVGVALTHFWVNPLYEAIWVPVLLYCHANGYAYSFSLLLGIGAWVARI